MGLRSLITTSGCHDIHCQMFGRCWSSDDLQHLPTRTGQIWPFGKLRMLVSTRGSLLCCCSPSLTVSLRVVFASSLSLSPSCLLPVSLAPPGSPSHVLCYCILKLDVHLSMRRYGCQWSHLLPCSEACMPRMQLLQLSIRKPWHATGSILSRFLRFFGVPASGLSWRFPCGRASACLDCLIGSQGGVCQHGAVSRSFQWLACAKTWPQSIVLSAARMESNPVARSTGLADGNPSLTLYVAWAALARQAATDASNISHSLSVGRYIISDECSSSF